MNIAIVAVAYNRIDSLKRLLDSLEKAYYANSKPTLIISVDKSNTDEVERFADRYQWPYGEKIVDKHNQNLGLRAHMLSLGKWFGVFDAIVVLEDDIVVSSNFYTYSCQTVDKYYDCGEVAGISLYGFRVNYQTGMPFVPIKNELDAYFMNCAMSWGEVWMRDSWMQFYKWYQTHQDFPEIKHLPRSICSWNQKSWLKYHTRYCIENNKFFVHPYTSLTTNYGDAGEHHDGVNTVYQVEMQEGNKSFFYLPEMGNEAVYYDGFFENLILYKVLGLSQEELCLDLQGEWNNRLNRRYWLTTKVVDYKVVRSFGLNYRPIEMNIILNNYGNEIFLYDTTITEKNISKTGRKSILYHYHLDNMFLFIRRYGFCNTWRDFFNVLKMKFKLKK